jgi:hypothetical protein
MKTLAGRIVPSSQVNPSGLALGQKQKPENLKEKKEVNDVRENAQKRCNR